MTHTTYRVIYTKPDGERTESCELTRREAVKEATKLKSAGCTTIFIDKYGPNTDFEGNKDYNDIVWLEDMKI